MNAALQQHIAAGGGICGTCAQPATATAENEGYSSCCNDRIEYGLEASDTVRVEACSHTRTREERVRYVPALGLPGSTAVEVRCVDCGSYIGEAS